MSTAADVKAVEIVREIRDRHHELLKNEAPEERERFYHEQAAALTRKLGLREEPPTDARCLS